MIARFHLKRKLSLFIKTYFLFLGWEIIESDYSITQFFADFSQDTKL